MHPQKTDLSNFFNDDSGRQCSVHFENIKRRHGSLDRNWLNKVKARQTYNLFSKAPKPLATWDTEKVVADVYKL